MSTIRLLAGTLLVFVAVVVGHSITPTLEAGSDALLAPLSNVNKLIRNDGVNIQEFQDSIRSALDAIFIFIQPSDDFNKDQIITMIIELVTETPPEAGRRFRQLSSQFSMIFPLRFIGTFLDKVNENADSVSGSVRAESFEFVSFLLRHFSDDNFHDHFNAYGTTLLLPLLHVAMGHEHPKHDQSIVVRHADFCHLDRTHLDAFLISDSSYHERLHSVLILTRGRGLMNRLMRIFGMNLGFYSLDPFADFFCRMLPPATRYMLWIEFYKYKRENHLCHLPHIFPTFRFHHNPAEDMKLAFRQHHDRNSKLYESKAERRLLKSICKSPRFVWFHHSIMRFSVPVMGLNWNEADFCTRDLQALVELLGVPNIISSSLDDALVASLCGFVSQLTDDRLYEFNRDVLHQWTVSNHCKRHSDDEKCIKINLLVACCLFIDDQIEGRRLARGSTDEFRFMMEMMDRFNEANKILSCRVVLLVLAKTNSLLYSGNLQLELIQEIFPDIQDQLPSFSKPPSV